VLARGRLGDENAEPVGVSMAALDGGELFVRPGTSDLRNAADHYRLGLYLPPPELDREPRQIVEIGSNMGASLTALAHRFPAARLIGVEPDPGNAAIARRNTARFGPRCTVVEVGIWDSDAELVVERGSEHGEHGFTLRPLSPADPPGTPATTALSLDSLLARHLPEGQIDYLQLSIEANEARIFAAGGEWADRTASLRTEAHPDLGYPAARVRADLEALGFRAWTAAHPPEKWVFAVRD
jgi:FkbM family methyltransferase